jgi:ankyrin repeat protein
MTERPTTDDALLAALETHDVAALQRLLANGLDPRQPVRGVLPVQILLEMYMRSSRFAACLRQLLAHGGALPEPRLAPVLLDDADTLRDVLRTDPALLRQRFDLVSAFTPLRGATALHVAAEYGHVTVAQALLSAGADANARALADDGGADGHTPLFHTVSSLLDHCEPAMHLLLAAGARTDVRLPALTWGRGFEWETTLFDVTPISYCQAGLLPQMHRRELDVYRNLHALLAAAGRPVPALPNVPNRYLAPRPR